MKTKPDATAYPEFAHPYESGLTKREVFASEQLAGLLKSGVQGVTYNDVVRTAIKYADTLIIELNREKDSEP